MQASLVEYLQAGPLAEHFDRPGGRTTERFFGLGSTSEDVSTLPHCENGGGESFDVRIGADFTVAAPVFERGCNVLLNHTNMVWIGARNSSLDATSVSWTNLPSRHPRRTCSSIVRKAAILSTVVSPDLSRSVICAYNSRPMRCSAATARFAFPWKW